MSGMSMEDIVHEPLVIDLIVPRVESKMTHGEQGGIHTPGHVSSAELFAVRWF